MRGFIVMTGDNTFAALGLPDPEELELRAQMCDAILAAMKKRHLGDRRAALAAGIGIRDYRKLLNGSPRALPIDRSLQILHRFNLRVEILQRPPRSAQSAAKNGAPKRRARASASERPVGPPAARARAR